MSLFCGSLLHKIGMPVVINLIALEIGEFSYNAVIHPKDADEITSSVDTDQTIRGRLYYLVRPTSPSSLMALEPRLVIIS